MKVQTSLRAVVFGGTGAVGKSLVPQLVNSDKWSKILCVVRSIPEEWNTYITQGKTSPHTITSPSYCFISGFYHPPIGVKSLKLANLS